MEGTLTGSTWGVLFKTVEGVGCVGDGLRVFLGLGGLE